MKKWTKALIGSLAVMSFLFSGCGGGEKKEEKPKTAKTASSVTGLKGKDVPKVELKLSTHCTDDDANTVLAKAFAEAVSQLSNGNMKVDVYTNGQLFGQAEALAALRQGTLDFANSDTSLFANYTPKAAVFDLPYLFESRKQAINAVKNKELKAKIQEAMVKASGIRPIIIEPMNFRNSLVKDMNKKDFADFKNLKMRTPEAPTIIAAFKAFGANPVVIPSGEAYTAVQTGVADGLEGHAEYMVLQKFYEVAKNYVQTQHVMTFTAYSMSEKTYQKLNKDQQEIIAKAADIALDKFLEYTDKLFEQKYKELEDKGVKITKTDLAPFRDAVKDYKAEFIAKNDLKELVAIIDKLDE